MELTLDADDKVHGEAHGEATESLQHAGDVAEVVLGQSVASRTCSIHMYIYASRGAWYRPWSAGSAHTLCITNADPAIAGGCVKPCLARLLGDPRPMRSAPMLSSGCRPDLVSSHAGIMIRQWGAHVGT